MTDDLFGRELRGWRCDDACSIAHDSQLIGQLEDFFQAMADEEDCDTLLTKLFRDREELLHLMRGERGCWLVHDQNACIERERFGNLDQLLVRYGQPSNRGIDAEMHVKGSEKTLNLLVHLLPCYTS